MIKKLLSINIPSNNKTKLLKESLNSIYNEIKNIDCCEICISDNSQTDETNKFINSLDKNYSINYRRSLDSLSLDENINTAVRMSNSEYSWIFGDDDLIIKGSINKIIKILKNVKPAILVVNSSSFYDKKIIESSRHFIKKDKIYNNKDNDEFLNDMGGYLTYAPSIIINNEVWKNFFNKNFIGTFFAHIYVIINSKIDNKAYYLSAPCINMRLHSQTWTHKYFEIWYDFYPRVIWSNPNYSNKIKQNIVKKNRLNSFLVTPTARAYGRYNLSVFKSIILISNQCNIFFKIYHFIISITPQTLFKILYIGIIKTGLKKRSINFSPELAIKLLKN